MGTLLGVHPIFPWEKCIKNDISTTLKFSIPLPMTDPWDERYMKTYYHKNQLNVGKYTIHGSYGLSNDILKNDMCFFNISS